MAAQVTVRVEGRDGGQVPYVLTDPPSADERTLAVLAGARDHVLDDFLHMVEAVGIDAVLAHAQDGDDADAIHDRLVEARTPALTVNGEVVIGKVGNGYVVVEHPFDWHASFAEAFEQVDVHLDAHEEAEIADMEPDEAAALLRVVDSEHPVTVNGVGYGPLDPYSDAWESDALSGRPGFRIVAWATGYTGWLDDRVVGYRLGRVGRRWFVDEMYVDTTSLKWFTTKREARAAFDAEVAGLEVCDGEDEEELAGA